MKMLMIVAVASMIATAAVAQTAPAPTNGDQAIESGINKNPGLGQDKPKERTMVGESNAVGSLGEQKAAGNNVAPALQKDCVKNPAECSEPLTTGATQQPGMPQQSK